MLPVQPQGGKLTLLVATSLIAGYGPRFSLLGRWLALSAGGNAGNRTLMMHAAFLGVLVPKLGEQIMVWFGLMDQLSSDWLLALFSITLS